VEYLAIGPESNDVIDIQRTRMDCARIFIWRQFNIFDLRSNEISKASPRVLILSRDESEMLWSFATFRALDCQQYRARVETPSVLINVITTFNAAWTS
jgi:hypothetical protein